MASETDLTAQINTVRSSRLRGVRTVQYSDRSVTYTSDAEMRQVEQDLLAELRTIRRRSRQSIAVPCKGF